MTDKSTQQKLDEMSAKMEEIKAKAKEPMSSDEWETMMIADADKLFAEHTMDELGHGWWKLRSKSGQLWCEIAVMANRCLAVWGDIDGVFFANYSGMEVPSQLVFWIANGSLDHAEEKASIGMTGIGTKQFVSRVARDDIKFQLDMAPESYGEDTWAEIGDDYTAAIRDAEDVIGLDGDGREVHDTLYRGLMNSDIEPDAWEWIYDVGMVPSDRVIMAYAAVSRLADIIRERLDV